MKKLSIVVPVYYNEKSLPHLFEELLQVEQALLERQVCMELIFVNDGSLDGSLAELLKIKASRLENTKVIKLTRNFGAVHASKTGTQFVTGDCFLVLAADLQDPPELILQMVDLWLKGSKYVICAREHRKDPATTKLYAQLYYILLHTFVMKEYPKSGYDLGLMDKAMLPYMQQSSKNINPTLFAYSLGFTAETIYYTRRERTYGRSRWTFTKKVTFFLDSMLGFSVVPIRIISLIGMFVSITSFFYGSVVAFNALRGIRDVSGFPTLVALTTFLLGLIIIMLGIIGEYIWRIFDEINKRPEAVIDEIY
jgi:glycosyltransferase involved in cell wall biosynthesis